MCDWKNHVPRIPTEEELATTERMSSSQAHDVQEFEHHDSEEAFYEMAARCVEVSG